MIKDIVFLIGGYASVQPINYFRLAQRRILARFGITSINMADANPPNYYDIQNIPQLVTDPAFAPLSRKSLDILRQNSLENPEVLLIQPLWLPKQPKVLATKSALCRLFFPDARQRAIFAVSPAVREVEGEYTRFRMYGFPQPFLLALRNIVNGHPSLEASCAMLEEQFGRGSVTIIPYQNEEQTCREFAATLVHNLPNAQQDIAALPFTPASVPAVLPRDVLAFMEGVNQLFAAPGSEQWSPHVWTKFGNFLRNGTYPSQLLSPDLRAKLKQKLDLEDMKTLARRGLPLWETHEASMTMPCESFPGLTDDDAFRLAKLLPSAHVDVLCKGPHLPERYQTYGARQCLSALQKVQSAKISSTKSICSSPKQPQPKASVLTLSYNHAPYIAECIESVVAQKTDFPIQHIIADDGSDDGTQDIILKYAEKYSHIVPVFQKNHSVGPRNIYSMFDMARTEYVALCDGDDYFTDPAKLQTQVDVLDANPAYALCFHVARVVYEGAPEKERLYPPEEILPRGIRPFYYLSDLIRNNFIQTNSVLYRWRFRDGLPDWLRVDLTPGDRYWHLLHAEMGKIGFINTVMSAYRRHEKSVFYLSEVDALKHRAKIGLKEIEVWDVINKHFNRKYEPIILDMVNHIFADCLLYDTRQEEEGIVEEPVLNTLSDTYPDFARHFLASLKTLNSTA